MGKHLLPKLTQLEANNYLDDRHSPNVNQAQLLPLRPSHQEHEHLPADLRICIYGLLLIHSVPDGISLHHANRPRLRRPTRRLRKLRPVEMAHPILLLRPDPQPSQRIRYLYPRGVPTGPARSRSNDVDGAL